MNIEAFLPELSRALEAIARLADAYRELAQPIGQAVKMVGGSAVAIAACYAIKTIRGLQ